MAIQLKDTKFGDTIVTKTSGMYSFDAAVDTTAGFSVTGGSGQLFSVNSSGDICGNSLSVAGGISACGLSTGSGGVAMSDVNVGCGAFKVDDCGNVYVRNDLFIVGEDGSTVSTINNGSWDLRRVTSSGSVKVFSGSTDGLVLYDGNGNKVFDAGNGMLDVFGSSSSGMHQVFVVGSCGIDFCNNFGDPAFHAEDGRLSVSGYNFGMNRLQPVFDVNTCGGLIFYNYSGYAAFQVGDGSLSIGGYSHATNSMLPVFDVNTCGLSLYRDDGYAAFQVGDGSLSISGYSYPGGTQPVFKVDTCGLNLCDSCGSIVFSTGGGNLDVCGFDSFSSGYYTKFSVDSCGIYVNLGSASGHITTTSVPGSGGSSVTVLTLG